MAVREWRQLLERQSCAGINARPGLRVRHAHVTAADEVVTYGSQTYRIVGRPDNVANQSVLVAVGLELIT